MRIMVSGQTAYVRELAGGPYAAHLGVMLQPNQGNHFWSQFRFGLPVCVDNAAFSNPNDRSLWNMLVDAWPMPIEWLAVPDVVGDHRATRQMFDAFVGQLVCEIGRVPVPLAFVAQNGCGRSDVPWDMMACLFVGGDTRWKLSSVAVRLCHEARDRGKEVHVGRVNSLKRLRFCRDVMLADSVDGTGFSKFGRRRLPAALAAIATPPAATRQMKMFV